jgi:hypothetical protein
MAGDFAIHGRVIARYERELQEIFEEVKGTQKDVLDIKIKQLAFMLAQTEELREIIKVNGTIELFKNGSQEFYREHPASANYQKIVKTILSYLKQMEEALPEGAEKGKSELAEFMSKKKGNLRKIK